MFFDAVEVDDVDSNHPQEAQFLQYFVVNGSGADDPRHPEDPPSAIEFRARSKGPFKRDGWNKCRIQAEGNRLLIWNNGVWCTDDVDDLDTEGHIALQHHGEKGQVYRFRNIRITETRKPMQFASDKPAREWTVRCRWASRQRRGPREAEAQARRAQPKLATLRFHRSH